MPQLALAAVGSYVGGAVGASIGYAAAGAAIGQAIGAYAGQALFSPTQRTHGPRLSDTKAAQVTYGSVLTYAEGHPRVGGCVVWASNKRAIATTTSAGGKGGPSAEHTSYTYEQDLLIVLTENAGFTGRRVWANGEMIWTRADDSDIESIESNSELWSRITFYNGAADQLPDPTYEAAVGTGNAPAYRDRSSVFIEGLQLGNSGQMPNLTFEITPADPEAGGQIGKLVWQTELTDGAYVEQPPQGAYVADPAIALAVSYVDSARFYPRAGGTVTNGTALTGADRSRPAQGNADRPVVGLGPLGAAPYFYLVGEDFTRSILIPSVLTSPPQFDYLGNAEMRYSLFGNRLAVASSLALGEGEDAYSGSLGHQGNVYVFTDAGAHVATIAHGAPVDSLAVTTAGLYVLSGTTVSLYETSGWTLSGTFAAPVGTNPRIFPDSAGVLCAANAGAEVFRWLEDAWVLQGTLNAAVDLGTNSASHMAGQEHVYAVAKRVVEGPDTEDYRWWRSTGGAPSDPATFHKDLGTAISRWVPQTLANHLAPDGSPRATRNPQWSIVVQEPVSIVSGAYTLIEHVQVNLTYQAYYPYPGDIDDYPFDGFHSGYSSSAHFYRFVYRVAPSETVYLDTYRGVAYAVGLEEPTLEQVVERQCERAGLPLEYVDASELASQNVRAMAISQITSPRQVIEMLAAAYHFTCVESEVLRFVRRGGDPVLTIPYEDLVARDDEEPLPIAKASDIELPVQVFVRYSNVHDDYQDGSESSDRLVSSGQSTSQVELPLGLTPTEAKRIADVHVMDATAAALRFGAFSLPRDYAQLEPTDVVNVEDADGATHRVRLKKRTDGDGVLTFEAVSDDDGALLSEVQTDEDGYTDSTTVRQPVDTAIELLDLPLLADRDDGIGFYAVAKPVQDVAFPGAALFKSADNVTYASVGTTNRAGVFGTATTVLPTGPVGVFDEGSSVTVDVGFGELSSVSREVLLASSEANLLSIGSEVVQFRDAELLEAGVYVLRGLLRGRRGTEWAVGGHGAGEPVVLLDAAVRRVPMGNVELGVLRYWKGVTLGRSLTTAQAEEFTAEGVSQKPWAPVDLRFARDVAGDLTITLKRRSRLSTRFFGSLGPSVPLGEESERYELEVLDGATVVRTLQSTNGSFSYSAADQASDFGSAPATVAVRAFQISAAVGRGYPAEAEG